ncbi:MAG: hypothetical protein LC740_11900, partial [Actinobacteria bacterium]|nr:hypothetical protein [Actinomycetota bacterium]
LHIRLTLDDQYESLLSAGNNSKQHGDLVVEYMARDAGHLTEPKTNDHLDIVGAWVSDIDHDWNEIHPVFSASLNGEPEETSGPQFGGSPTSDRSSNAAADCRTEAGQTCTGYGRGTDSSDEPSDSEADKGAQPEPGPQSQEQPTPTPQPTPDVPPAPAQPSGGSRPPISKNSCPPDAPIKGNQSGIYHPPGSRSYNVTNPEECFASSADAEAAGYRAPKG